MSESTNKLSEDTNRFTLRVLKRGTLHMDIDDALTVGYDGDAVVELGNINARTFYPVALVTWDGTNEVVNPDLVQYFPNQRTEWDADGNVEKMMNWSVESTGDSPAKLVLHIRAYVRSAPREDDLFYYTICSLEAGPRVPKDEEEWSFN